MVDTQRVKLPFGVAQIGKSFRNEITTENFIFRTREFEQMEMEFFLKPDPAEEAKWFDYWVEYRFNWYVKYGLKAEHLRRREHATDELSHYSRGTTDVEYLYPFGWGELEGIAKRGSFDLDQHAKFSGKDLTYFDEDAKARYRPWVIEPALGVDRAMLAFMLDAYDEDVVENEERIVLRLDPRLAPIKVAIYPLLRKNGQPEKANAVREILQRHFTTAYDQAGSIGRRYRRQDEVGTPYGVTIDHQTMEDDTVTLRDRDTTTQERVPIAHLVEVVRDKIGWTNSNRTAVTTKYAILNPPWRELETIPEMARVHPEIYFFGAGVAEGRAAMRDLLGGKGANLSEMASLKLPVPPGFTISTRVCNYFYDNKNKYPKGLAEGVKKSVARIEKALGRKFGDATNPLLVSVRSGARVSMPGMMDTVLNLGLTDETVKGLEAVSGNPRFAWDSYRRFCQMYGDVVLKLKPENKNDADPFEELIDRKKAARGVKQDVDLGVDDLRELVGEFRDLIRRRVGRDIPQDPTEQLWEAIGAVFGSWNNDRAITYRRINNIPGDWGTAVTVQSMVFGNLGADCATGVAFTRDPGTGEKGIYGEFLPNAQGEDVVAGIRTPRPNSLVAGRKMAERVGMSEAERKRDHATLEETFPSAYRELVAIGNRLERHFHDCQDLEFTIERERLFMLQTRNGKRTAISAVRMAVDMADEKLIDRKSR